MAVPIVTLAPGVLFVPDSIFWVTGELARSYAHHNPQFAEDYRLRAREQILAAGRVLADRFDLVRFLRPYAPSWGLDQFAPLVPVVMSHHHVTDWCGVSHNVNGDAVRKAWMTWRGQLACSAHVCAMHCRCHW